MTGHKTFPMELKLFILFLGMGLIPLLVTAGFYYLGNQAMAFAAAEVSAIGVVLGGFFLTRYVSSPIHGFSDKLLEIASSNRELSQRTHEQAAALEEIAATIEEVNSSIHQTSNNSERARQISQSTLDTVKTGEKTVQDALGAMVQISTSSRQIAEIIEVVHDIASQTNILAINAAVEAARAGEQGKGFAIVATEIKNLARRTGESSKEIEKLVQESVERVEKGHQLIHQSAETLRQVVANTVQTTEVIAEVASNMREQAVATQQMEYSVDQLNQITQQNAAMVEELFSIKNTEKPASPGKKLRRLQVLG